VESTVQHVTHSVAEQVIGTIFSQHTNTGPTGPSIQEQIDQAKAEQERLQAAYDQLKQQIEQSEHTEPEIDLDNQTRITTRDLQSGPGPGPGPGPAGPGPGPGLKFYFLPGPGPGPGLKF